jgi:hypothetical protein
MSITATLVVCNALVLLVGLLAWRHDYRLAREDQAPAEQRAGLTQDLRSHSNEVVEC